MNSLKLLVAVALLACIKADPCSDAQVHLDEAQAAGPGVSTTCWNSDSELIGGTGTGWSGDYCKYNQGDMPDETSYVETSGACYQGTINLVDTEGSYYETSTLTRTEAGCDEASNCYTAMNDMNANCPGTGYMGTVFDNDGNCRAPSPAPTQFNERAACSDAQDDLTKAQHYYGPFYSSTDCYDSDGNILAGSSSDEWLIVCNYNTGDMPADTAYVVSTGLCYDMRVYLDGFSGTSSITDKNTCDLANSEPWSNCNIAMEGIKNNCAAGNYIVENVCLAPAAADKNDDYVYNEVPECMLPCEADDADCDCFNVYTASEGVMADVIRECYTAGGTSWAYLNDECNLSEDDLTKIANAEQNSARTAKFGLVALGSFLVIQV